MHDLNNSSARRFSLFPCAAVMLILSGCAAVGPDYQKPEVKVPDQWQAPLIEGVTEGQASIQTWWTLFDDPVLDELITRTQADSLNIRMASARVQAAAYRAAIARGAELPQADAGGEASRGQLSNEGAIGQAVSRFYEFPAQNSFEIGVGAGWIIDVFGQVRRSVEASDASYQASIENYRDVLVILLSKVAQTYTQVRAMEQRIEYAETNEISQVDTLNLTRNRYNSGLSSMLDVRQAETILATTRANIDLFNQLLGEKQIELAILVGVYPGELDDLLAKDSEIPEPPADIMVSVPADLLRQRPDVRAAERQLAARTAQVGVVTADLYPKFSLQGAIGRSSVDFDDLSKSDARTWQFSLPVQWNLFDGHITKNRIGASEERVREALYNYEQTVLIAVGDVESALTALDFNRRRLANLEIANVAASDAVRLVLVQYRTGLTDFQNVLDAQRSLFQLQSEIAGARGEVANAAIALYAALGGGWDENQPLAE